LVAVSVGTAILLLLSALWIVNGVIDRADRRELLGHYDAFHSLLQQQARQAVAMAALVASMTPVQQAMANGDRAALANQFAAGFADLKATYGIDQFQFHTPPATSFFRVHLPAKFGDDLSGFRRTVVEANTSHRPVAGLEGGVAGLGIRGVVPVALAGKPAGSVEFGLVFGQELFAQVKQLRHVDVAVQLSDGDGFRYFGGTLDQHSFFGPNDYRAATAGDILVTKGEFAGRPVAALLGPVQDFSGKPLGAVELVMDNSDYVASVRFARGLVLAITSFGLLAAGLIGWLLARGIARPILAMTATMHRLAEHDLAAEITGGGRGDELGSMAAAVQVFKDSMIAADVLASEQAEARRMQDLRQEAMERHTQDFGTSVAGVMASLVTSSETMRHASQDMADAAEAVNAEARETTAGALKSSEDLTSVAASVEELTSSVAEIARQVGVSGDIARHAVQRVGESQTTMSCLSEAATRIGDVVQLISNIAGQTNLLALNATIEAARAGEAGKGFAVVAGEVKALAAQTAKATAEIGGQIETVRTATEQAVAGMNAISSVIRQIDEVSGTISVAVEQQSSTTREIAGSVQAVTGATSTAAHAMEHVVEVAGRAGRSSGDVLAGAGVIAHEAATLRDEVDHFLLAIRSASGERRRYERVSGKGTVVCLEVQGRRADVTLLDLSCGGAATNCEWRLPAGTAAEIDVPGAGARMTGRVVRSDGNELGLVFSGDPANLAQVDRVLDMLTAMPAAA
jgi:methyl-accepting chemotaxis protein